MISEPWGPEIQGQTALSDEDYAHLRPFWVANRADLNLAEAQNINTAQNFYLNRRGTAAHLLDDLEVREMHARMFGSVWTWAGRYRTKNLNLGVDHVGVAQGVRNLMDDARYWFGSPPIPAVDTQVAALHHRLVAIHPFVNGNGRLARLFTDTLLVSLGQPRFSWGGANNQTAGVARREYISALKAADRGGHEALNHFVRS